MDWFLFEQREGYCDYFASAMVVMLRSQGIPARWVRGYAGGELVVSLDLQMYVGASPQRDHVLVDATPTIDMTIAGGIPAGLSTADLPKGAPTKAPEPKAEAKYIRMQTANRPKEMPGMLAMMRSISRRIVSRSSVSVLSPRSIMSRVMFGKPIGAHQAIRHAIADAKTKTLAMRLMLYHAAQLVQDRKPSALESSMTKLFCCEGASEVTLACQRVMGAYGLSDLMDMERYVRDAISLPIVGGSSNMQKNNIANRLKLAE